MALCEEIIVIVASGLGVAIFLSKLMPVTRLSTRQQDAQRRRLAVPAAHSSLPIQDVGLSVEQGEVSTIEHCEFTMEVALVITQARAEGAHQIATRLEAALEKERVRQDNTA
jgi:hypothetical protein